MQVEGSKYSKSIGSFWNLVRDPIANEKLTYDSYKRLVSNQSKVLSELVMYGNYLKHYLSWPCEVIAFYLSWPCTVIILGALLKLTM